MHKYYQQEQTKEYVGCSVADTPKREPDIANALQQLTSEIQYLGEATTQLYAKLAPVSRQEPCDKEDTPQRGGQCELSDRLYNLRTQVMHLRAGILQQIDMLEI